MITETELKNIMKTAVSSVMATVSAGNKTIISPTEVRTIATQIAKDAESGSIDRFEAALMKTENVLDKLGVDLKDFNSGLAKTLKETQEQRDTKIAEVEALRSSNIVAEVKADKQGREFMYETHILTKKEIADRTDLLEKNKELASDREKQIIARMDELLLKEKLSNEDKREIVEGEKQIQADKLKLQAEEKILTPLSSDGDMNLGPTSTFYEELKAPFVAVGDAFMSIGDLGKDIMKIGKFFADGGLMKGLKSFKKGIMAIGKFFMSTKVLIGIAIVGVLASIYYFRDQIKAIGKFIVGIPGFIMKGLTKVFTMYTDFYKTMINAVIKLINKIPGVNIGLLETSTMKKEREEGEKAERIKAGEAEGEMGMAVTQTDMVGDMDAETGAMIAQKQTDDGLAPPEGYDKIAYNNNQPFIAQRQIVGDNFTGSNSNQSGDASVSTMLADAQKKSADIQMAKAPPVILNNTNQSNISSSGSSTVGFVQNKNVDDTFINLNSATA